MVTAISCSRILLLGTLYRICIINEQNYLAIINWIVNHQWWSVIYTFFKLIGSEEYPQAIFETSLS